MCDSWYSFSSTGEPICFGWRMNVEYIVWDQIAFHHECPLETFNIVKKYFPDTCDEKLNKLIQEKLEIFKEQEREYEEEYNNFLIENNMTHEEYCLQLEKEEEEKYQQKIKEYFMLSDEDMEDNNIDISSLKEFFEVCEKFRLAVRQHHLIGPGAGEALQRLKKEELDKALDKIYLLGETVNHETMKDISEAIYITENKWREKATKKRSKTSRLPEWLDSVKQIHASLEDSFAKRNDIFRKGKRMPGSGFSKI